MKLNKISVIVNDTAKEGWIQEHGLSLLIEFNGTRFLFDTGSGKGLIPNLERFGISPDSLQFLVFSHGHNDHTGGLSSLAPSLSQPIPIWFLPGLTRKRFSLSPPITRDALSSTNLCCSSAVNRPRNISIPSESIQFLDSLPKNCRKEISGWCRIKEGIFLTGAIPRHSDETTGGAFFFDEKGEIPDLIQDEQAILLNSGNKSGTLIHGCCHSGIINTLHHTAARFPDLHIRTIIGGLHLVHADRKRLEMTAAYLNTSKVERLVLSHCTGERAIEFLKKNFFGKTETISAGESLIFE